MLLVTLFITSAVMAVPTASAHFTLGDQTTNGPGGSMGGLPWVNGIGRYSKPDNHSAGIGYQTGDGHLAYVTPGSLYVPPNQQLNYYSPNGSVMVDTTGDLVFYINVSHMLNQREGPWISGMGPIDIVCDDGVRVEAGQGYSPVRPHFLYIAIPPDFTPPVDWMENEGQDGRTNNGGLGRASNVATTITNDYRWIQTGKFRGDHPYAPGWWFVRISAPDVNYPDPLPAQWLAGHPAPGYYDVSSRYLYPPGTDPWLDRQVKTGPYAGCYKIWVKDFTAPTCAGKYHFKVFYTNPDTANSYLRDQIEQYVSFPPQNYPVLLVKGEVDPAYITGRVRYGGHSTYYYGQYYGQGVLADGRVIAEGTAIDPLTNEPIDREVCGIAYFNSSAQGYFELEGLAPGIYTLTACADGFLPKTLDQEITVKRGQSLHGIDIYVIPAAKLKFKVNSKCPTGPVPFPLYTAIGDSYPGDTWGINAAGAATTSSSKAVARFYIKDLDGNTKKAINAEFDVASGTVTSFTTPVFGDPTCYKGIGTGYTGMVPDDSAHNVCGLEPGTYTVEVYIFGYVQVDTYTFTVPETEFTGSIFMDMDVYKGGTVTATVHFHDTEMPSAEVAPPGQRRLYIEAIDSDGNLQAFNFTQLKQMGTSETIRLIGDWNVWFNGKMPEGMPEDTYTFKVWTEGYVQQEFPMHTITWCSDSSFSFHLIKGANITATIYSRDWEDPSQPLDWQHGAQKIRVYARSVEDDKVADCGSFTITPGTSSITVNFDGSGGSPKDYLIWHVTPTGIPTGTYYLTAFTVGYVQLEPYPEVYVMKGSSSGDIPVYIFHGGKIIVVVDFKIEEIPEYLPDDWWSYYFRIKAFDEDGNLAAANITAVPQASTYNVAQWPWAGGLNPAQPAGVQTWVFELNGFNRFTTVVNTAVQSGAAPGYDCPACTRGYHEPTEPKIAGCKFGWPGNYDPYGIPPGTYTIEVTSEVPYPGYIQLLTVTAVTTWNGETSVIFEMDQGAKLSGNVWTRNYMGDWRSGSWMRITAEGPEGVGKMGESADGSYGFSGLMPGEWTITSELTPPGGDAGYVSGSLSVATTWGGSSSGQNFYHEESGVPIPEFPTGILALISALAASLFLVRWRKQIVLPGH